MREEGRTGLLSRHVLDEAVVAQHMQQRRLAGIVEAQEDDLAALIIQAYNFSDEEAIADNQGGKA